MKFYRYEDMNSLIGVKIHKRVFHFLRETPKGYWIKPTWDYQEEFKKWVSKYGKKRYAYPTKEEALQNLKARKNRQVKILESRLSQARQALSLANNMLNSRVNDNNNRTR